MLNSQPSSRRRAVAGLDRRSSAGRPAHPDDGCGTAESYACERNNNSRYERLLECVTLAGVREHQAAFQAIADANGGTRADQTPGYTASVDYVVETMTAAGWDVERVPFVYQEEVADPRAAHAGAGDVRDRRVHRHGARRGRRLPSSPVDINLTPPRASTSGCDGAYTEAAVGAPLVADPGGANDFASFPAGAIALIQRGGCSFALKAHNALAAGASARHHLQPGQHAGRASHCSSAAPQRQLARPSARSTIPVVGASFADGAALAQAGSTRPHRACVSRIGSPRT